MALPFTVGTVSSGIGFSPFPQPFLSSGGEIFLVGYDASNPTRILVKYSSAPDTSWTEQTLALTGGFNVEINQFSYPVSAFQVGDNLHLATVQYDSVNGQYPYRYHVYNMSSKTFTTSNELIVTYTSIYSGSGIPIVVRSDGTVVVQHSVARVSVMGGQYDRVGYSRRSTGGVWTTNIALDSGGTNNFYPVQSALISGSQRTFLAYWNNTITNSVRVKVLTSANVLGSEVGPTASFASRGNVSSKWMFLIAGGSTPVALFWAGVDRLTFSNADTPTVVHSTGNISSSTDDGTDELFYDPNDGTNGTLYFCVHTAQSVGSFVYKTSTDNGATLSAQKDFQPPGHPFYASAGSDGTFYGLIFTRGADTIAGTAFVGTSSGSFVLQWSEFVVKSSSSASFAGSGSLTVDATVPANNIKNGSFTGAGDSTLVARGTLIESASFTGAGAGSFAALGIVVDFASASFNGAGSLTAVSQSGVAQQGSASFNGAGAFAANARGLLQGSSSVNGAGSFGSVARAIAIAAGSFNGAGSFVTREGSLLNAAASFNGAGAASFNSSSLLQSSESFDGTGSFGADANRYLTLRPDNDILDGGWTTETGGTVLYASVNELVADDANYIRSATNPANDTCEVSLSDPSATVGQDIVVQYRYAKENVGRIDLVVNLKQGTTVIATWTHTDIGLSYVTATQTLTSLQVSSITDYNNLSVEITANAA